MSLSDLTQWFKDEIRADGWFSLLTGLGGRRDKTANTRIGAIVPLDDQTVEALYLSTGLGGAIVDSIVDDAIGAGTTTKNEALDKEIARFGAERAIGNAWRWGRAYGRGAVYLGLSDRLGPQYAPVALSQVGRGDLAFVRDVDGSDLSVARTEEDRRSPRYGEPTHYYVSGSARGVTEIHASRFVFFGGALTPHRIRYARSGRDLSVLQRPYEAMRDEGIAHSSIVAAFQDLSQAVFKIKGLASMIANGQASIARDRMELVDLARSVARAVVVDAEGEDFGHVGAANLTGVDAAQARLLMRVSAASKIPATVLLGTAPVGMNATGESDLRIWYRRVEIERVEKAPAFLTIFRAIAASSGIADWTGDLEFAPLWTPTEKEIAEKEKIEADTDAVRISSGVLSAEEVSEIRYGGSTPEEVYAERLLGGAEDFDEEVVLRPNAGEQWIDTADQHRLRVNTVANDRVYFVDLDSETPDQQWAWKEATFLERARKIEIESPGGT